MMLADYGIFARVLYVRVDAKLNLCPTVRFQLTEEQGVAAIEEFASCDMSRIRNKRYAIGFIDWPLCIVV